MSDASRSGLPAPEPPIQSGHLGAPGHALHWERCGRDSDPAVIFLHHGLGSTRAWKAQLAAFARRGWQAVAYDRWGYGRSSPRPSLDLPTFATDVQDLSALLDGLSIHRAALVGHSDGGTTALYFAAQFPQRVAALVTVAAHIYLEQAMAPGILGIRKSYESDPRFREGMRRAHGEQVEAVFRNWYEGWVQPGNLGWDMRPMLGGVRCPTLVIQGELDEHATPQHARDLAEGVADGRLWLVPGVGHMTPQDSPDEFNRRVLEFLEPFRLAAVGQERGSGAGVHQRADRQPG
jgi:pimeloyl-ACP methyl ester carboxylesterase